MVRLRITEGAGRVVLWVIRPSTILFQALVVPLWYVSTLTVSASPVASSGMSQFYRFESARLARRGATPICGISHCHNQPAMAGPLYHHSSPTNVLIHRYSVFPQSMVFHIVSRLSGCHTCYQLEVLWGQKFQKTQNVSSLLRARDNYVQKNTCPD
jgi:hypothetical protein